MTPRKKLVLKIGLAGLGVCVAVGIWKRELVVVNTFAAFFDVAVWFHACRLPGCDRVEIYHVRDLEYGADGGPKQIEDETKRFVLQTQGGTTVARVVERKELTGSDASEFLSLWRALKFGGRYSHLCHMPGYGLRFHSPARVLFDTTLCFECTNFPVLVWGKHGLNGFDGSQSSAGELLKRLQTLFPESVPKPRVRLPVTINSNPEGKLGAGVASNTQP